MNLSLMTFSTLREQFNKGMDAAALCRMAKENGIEELDLMIYEARCLGTEALRTAMAEAGIRCGCLISGMSCFHAPEKVEDELRGAMDLADALGTSLLMVVPGSEEDRSVCAALSRDELITCAAQAYALAVKMGEARGIRVCFEDTPHCWKPLSAPTDCLALLNRVPSLGLVFDTANFLVSDPANDLLAAYELLKERIVRVHVKDVVKGDFESGEACIDGQLIRPVTTGSGILPIRRFLERLRADGYDGGLALEYSAKEGVEGEAHICYVAPYAEYVREVWNGTLRICPSTQIPGLDKPVSRLFFGTAIMPMAMGKNCDALLDAALSHGINAFDCARGYGYAEKSLGGWIKRRNNRDRVVVLTKCGNVDREGVVHVTRQIIEEELIKSLEMLETDYIDIYLLHRDDPKTPVSEVIDCLNEQQRAGKIKIFGASNWTHQRIAEANAYAEAHGLQGFAVSSPNYGLARQMLDPWGGDCVTISGPENTEARDWYAALQMPVLAYSSLGRGFFSGKFSSGDFEGAKQVLDPFAQRGYLYPENMERLARAEKLAKRDQMTVTQIAMRYVFAGSMNVFGIVSTTNPSRLGENVAAACVPLNAADAAYLEGKA